MKKTIVVASQNPVKHEAIRLGFARIYPHIDLELIGADAKSGVSDQPSSDEETLQGALNRVKAIQEGFPRADYWAGLEGGIQPVADGITAFAWVVVSSGMQIGKARTGAFFLPKPIIQLLNQGLELGKADDIVFGRTNSKQNSGAIGLLTNDAIDRAALYSEAVILAMVPFLSPHLYQ
jgi:inosine/xanthosine triphosphatase